MDFFEDLIKKWILICLGIILLFVGMFYFKSTNQDQLQGTWVESSGSSAYIFTKSGSFVMGKTVQNNSNYFIQFSGSYKLKGRKLFLSVDNLGDVEFTIKLKNDRLTITMYDGEYGLSEGVYYKTDAHIGFVSKRK